MHYSCDFFFLKFTSYKNNLFEDQEYMNELKKSKLLVNKTIKLGLQIFFLDLGLPLFSVRHFQVKFLLTIIFVVLLLHLFSNDMIKSMCGNTLFNGQSRSFELLDLPPAFSHLRVLLFQAKINYFSLIKHVFTHY